MWILTQDGKRIINTDGLSEICVSDPLEGKTDYAVTIKRRIDGRPYALGFYQKQERAMEILKEMLKVQAEFILQKETIMVMPKTFQMPQDAKNKLKTWDCSKFYTGENWEENGL